ESLNHYLEAFHSSENLSDYSQLTDLTHKISAAYAVTGQLDSALIYMTFSRGYQDSVEKRLKDALLFEIDFTKEQSKVSVLRERLKRKDSDLKKRTTISRLSTVIGIIALTLLISVILYYRQRKKNALKQKKIDDLLNKQGEETMYAMLDGQESEKNRIASELHDTLGSILSTVKLYFKSMDKEIDQLKQENIEQFEKANELLDEAVQEVRKISHDLSTGVLKDLGLFRAVQNLISKIEGSGEIQIELMTHGTDDDLLIVNQSAIYRIIQESLSNTLKHAKAKKVSIQLNVFEDLFNLIIEDDGVGFDANQMVSNIGMGLRSNKARVSKMNGTFNIDSGKGIGTTINIDIPLEDNSKKNEDGKD
ncbi:MAG: sensor histidine kinase, partial [Crocinitomicaceae bacterium]